MTPESTKRQPTLFSPQQQLLGELPGLLSLWKYDRAGGRMWLKTGQGLVTAWAGLHRLVPLQPPRDILRRLDNLISDDGAIFIEVVFNYPGMGLAFYNAALNVDYQVLLGFTLVATLATIVGNILADVGYAVLDPRVRYS